MAVDVDDPEVLPTRTVGVHEIILLFRLAPAVSDFSRLSQQVAILAREIVSSTTSRARPAQFGLRATR